MNTKLHAVTDAIGRPLKFFMTAGQVNDYTGAAALLGSLPDADWMIADRVSLFLHDFTAWFSHDFCKVALKAARISVLRFQFHFGLQ